MHLILLPFQCVLGRQTHANSAFGHARKPDLLTTLGWYRPLRTQGVIWRHKCRNPLILVDIEACLASSDSKTAVWTSKMAKNDISYGVFSLVSVTASWKLSKKWTLFGRIGFQVNQNFLQRAFTCVLYPDSRHKMAIFGVSYEDFSLVPRTLYPKNSQNRTFSGQIGRQVNRNCLQWDFPPPFLDLPDTRKGSKMPLYSYNDMSTKARDTQRRGKSR